ncbi:MAG: hypothetical protein GF350_03000 [Chitinivibrionales bacterium]|nr:hypothetical protein [Chitinivibrionales bacterium]
MKTSPVILFCCALYGVSVCGQAPLDNPVAAFYSGNQGYPAWTDRIAWDNIIDMSVYADGDNDFEKFERARDELASQGGGVLYYPGGSYDFSAMPADGPDGRGLMLKSGVVIRGETPSGDDHARDGTLALPTKFSFSFQNKGGGQVPRDWNIVGIMPLEGKRLKDVATIGIVWVELTGAAIYFGPDIEWGATWATAGSWKSGKVKQAWAGRVPDGTHPWDPFCGGRNTYIGVGDGRLVFGCLLKDAAVLNNCVDEGFGTDGFYTAKFGPRIGVYGSRIFIANNAIPRSSRNFFYQQATSSGSTKKLLFDYGKNCGIDVNKDLLGMVREGLLAEMTQGYFEPGVAVIDNFVFNHGHKGFNVAGEWTVIRNNRNERAYLQEAADVYGIGVGWELTLDGYLESEAGGSGSKSDNLSRGFDLGGRALWIDNNWLNNTGSNPGNDGEGILCQSHGGTQWYSWAVTGNTHVRGAGEGGYFGGYDVQQYGSLIAWNTLPGWVGSTKAGANIDAAYVDNQAGGGTRATGTDVITSCPSGTPNAPALVSATAENDHVVIRWKDQSNNEAGFRIDRTIDNGDWTAIAFRPRKSAGSEHNTQEWHDYLAPAEKLLRYRVVAVNCDNNDAGASIAVGPVNLAGDAVSVDAPHAVLLRGRHEKQAYLIDLRGRCIGTLQNAKCTRTNAAGVYLMVPLKGAGEKVMLFAGE